MNKKGFTLIEIIVVIAVIAILSGIALISFSGINDRAEESACKANMKNVQIGAWTNAQLYDSNVLEVANVILSEEENPYFADKVVCPDGGEYSASYDSETGQLIISCSVHGEVIASAVGSGSYKIVFSDQGWNLSDYIHNSLYKLKDGFLKSSYGLFFSDTSISDHYKVETSASLSGSGGFGILVEATAEDATHDNSYAVQFDKTYNKSIVIRQRTDGKEGSPIAAVKVSDYIPAASADSWWNDEHVLSVEVEKVSDGQSALTVMVDGVKIGYGDSTAVVSPIEGADKTGLRSWTSETSYRYFDYTDLN